MAVPTFNGAAIFGSQTRQVGPIPKTRNQRERLPGVKGYRIYNLVGSGPDTFVFTIRGRLVSLSLPILENTLTAASRSLGNLGTLRTAGGNSYLNCELISYQQVSPIQGCLVGGIYCVTCEVSATLETAGGA